MRLQPSELTFELFLGALDPRAEMLELGVERLVAAVQMIDAAELGRVFRGKARDYQPHAGAQVGRHHRSATQLRRPADYGGGTFHHYVGAHPRQFLGMNRFSKIVSVMTEVPSACVSIAII